MSLLAALLRAATLAAGLGGLLALWAWTRPPDLASAGAVLAGLGLTAAADPVFWALAAGALVTAVAARRASRTDSAEPSWTRRASRSFTKGEPRGPEEDLPGFVDGLLHRAADLGASDLHLEPGEEEGTATVRVDGGLREIARYPAVCHPDVVRRLKVLADLVPWQTSRPQDGRFRTAHPAGPIEVRLASVPSTRGERVALRLARAGIGLPPLAELGLGDSELRRWRDLLGRDQGMLLVTGPTGSGKTTTLYASLREIHRSRGARTRIATIEDPIEVELDFADQTRVDPAAGLGWAAAFKAVLRADPDVLMLGEIRDRPTAEVAVQAGLSGHLVLATLHAESAAGTLRRLLDLDVAAADAASAVQAVLSQRLLRRQCVECRAPELVDLEDRRRVEAAGFDGATPFFGSGGCEACGHSGFRGRVALFDLLVVDDDVRAALRDDAPAPELARRAGSSIVRAALGAAARGEVSLADALRLREGR